ncbi:DUF5133 domain-containing protein [Streptomyces sp. NPDC093982]|uniref:DUF5133 domain-containing protein n=1 Tax=Streptomyces sp. NPDC093982 TaxID=3155077 RepID=UPI0034312984
MLTTHPRVLQNLIDQYEKLSTLHPKDISPEVRQRIDDVAYTLCVCTGTRNIDTALAVARDQLSSPRPQTGRP